MRKPQPVIDAKKCRPQLCRTTGCVAAAACTMNILEQEEPGEPPMILMACRGCGKCALACPHRAITMS